MYNFLLVCHILIALVLVVVVLLQSGKGGGLGAGFGGGGANTLFGSSGGSNFFTKFTMGLAVAFMVTSLSLTVVKSRGLKTSLFDQQTTGVPATSPNAPAPAQPSAAPAQPGNPNVPATAPVSVPSPAPVK